MPGARRDDCECYRYHINSFQYLIPSPPSPSAALSSVLATCPCCCCTSPPPPLPLLPPLHSSPQSQAGAVNADLFAREPSNVPLLLALLEEEPVGISDFYVRYHTVQLLTGLLLVRGGRAGRGH